MGKSECPEKCINNGKWEYFKNSEDIIDESQSLSITCLDKTDGVGDETSITENDGQFWGIVIGVLVTILVVIIIAFAISFQRRRKDARKNDAESIECGSI